MCETCNNPDHEEFDLRAMWAAADKKDKDWRDKGDVALLEQMHDAWAGLKSLGWKEIEYCPKDGTRFLAITPGSTGVFPHYYRGEWPDGHWWCEAHGDLWPSRPILWKPMPSNLIYPSPADDMHSRNDTQNGSQTPAHADKSGT